MLKSINNVLSYEILSLNYLFARIEHVITAAFNVRPRHLLSL